MPLVSIITCTYNDSQFLPKCLESCFSQEIDKEIILVDDCSKKPIEQEALDAISKYNVQLIRHDKNMGLSAARNTGISAAKSDWVIPLDADDWFYKNTVKILFDNKDGTDIVSGNCTDSGHVYAPAISKGALSKEIFKRENPLVCSSLFTKEIWSKAGGYTVRNGPHYEDWNFWAKCFSQNARFKYLPIQIYNHTSRPDSMLRFLHPNRDFYVKIATEGVL
jgi:glycosyltransferase involved in cell wall biosynthesis